MTHVMKDESKIKGNRIDYTLDLYGQPEIAYASHVDKGFILALEKTLSESGYDFYKVDDVAQGTYK